jgi:hypothetical protein
MKKRKRNHWRSFSEKINGEDETELVSTLEA